MALAATLLTSALLASASTDLADIDGGRSHRFEAKVLQRHPIGSSAPALGGELARQGYRAEAPGQGFDKRVVRQHRRELVLTCVERVMWNENGEGRIVGLKAQQACLGTP